MELSLVELCLVPLRDSIERGEHHQLHTLPIRMRQPLLDFILMHGTIENPNCVRSLGSIEFLQGMTTLDIQEGRAKDSEYLSSVADVMGSTVDGELMGDKVPSLKLNIYAKFSDSKFQSLCETNILDVARLISKCRNLETLGLRVAAVKVDGAPSEEQPVSMSPLRNDFIEYRCGILDKNSPFQICISVLEKVKEFSLVVTTLGYWNCRFPFMTIGNTPIQFNRLVALHLSNVEVDITSWGVFLNSFRETLTMLHLCDFIVCGASGKGYSPLPIPLPHLKEVSVQHDSTELVVNCQPSLGEVFSKYPELEHVDLLVWLSFRVGKRVLESLSKLPAVYNVEIKVYAFDGDDVGWILDNGFGEKITSLELKGRLMRRRFIAAMEHTIDIGKNLTEFSVSVSEVDGDLRMAMASVSRFFGNKEQTFGFGLSNLWLCGAISHDVLNTIFENCLGLELLCITWCEALNDEHLIEWARRGARPMKLFFGDCYGISDQGIIPILKNSACRLKEFDYRCRTRPWKVTKWTWMRCFEYCRYARRITGYKDDDDSGLLADAHASKCFYKQFGE